MASDRYKAMGSEASSQPGSSDSVLRNKAGITSSTEMNDAELALLLQLYEYLMDDAFPERGLRISDLMEWHRLWLGNLYDWAGQERRVNLAKGDFHFASAAQIPRLLNTYDQDFLQRFTPCFDMDAPTLSEAIAACHVELILIHSFREGNGRLSRLLADVMAVQAGREPLDYSRWDADKPSYFTAIRCGMDRNYAPMRELVNLALVSTNV